MDTFIAGLITAGGLVLLSHYVSPGWTHPITRHLLGVAAILAGMLVWLGRLRAVGIFALAGCIVAAAALKVMRGVKPEHRTRIELENIMALHIRADDRIRDALLLLSQGARTAEDNRIMGLMVEARGAIEAAHGRVAEMHPNRREGD